MRKTWMLKHAWFGKVFIEGLLGGVVGPSWHAMGKPLHAAPSFLANQRDHLART